MQLLTTREAADRLAVSDARVRQLCHAGLLAGAEKLGRDWIIPEASVRQYVAKPVGWPKGRPRR